MTSLLLRAAASLLLLLLVTASHGFLGSASTIAISHATGTVCGVQAFIIPQSIRCARGNQSFSVNPNISFSSISGGHDYFCGLSSTRTLLFCWTTTNSSSNVSPKRIYKGPAALAEISVGETHVSAIQNGTGIRWWRGGLPFPTIAAGKYRSLTSGNGFTCAISVSNSSVRCWGSDRGQIGQQIEREFANNSMATIVAGDSHACGLNMVGLLVCKGKNDSGQLGPPPSSSPFEFSSLALGQTHSCAIRKATGTVICWGGGGGSVYSPTGNASMVLIVAGGNLTCGLSSLHFSVVCWGVRRPPPAATVLPLSILPGVCVDSSFCGCGVFPNSQRLCSGSGAICNSCDLGGPSPPPPPAQQAPPPPPSPPPVPRRRISKGILAFAIVGSVGGFVGICTLVFWLWTGVCRQNKVHNSVQPTIAGDANGGKANSLPTAAVTLFHTSSNSIKSRSKSSIFLRHGSRVMSRQRSGPSSAKRTDWAEEFTFEELANATNNFSPETKIGGGSFGTVYKGKLSDGREVAIKRSESEPRAKRLQEKESAFQSELAFLSRLHHKHLVGLVGFCEQGEERLLVYEYMKNGALYDHLHSNGGRGNADAGPLDSWKMRIKVLLDASRGIEYLHNYAVPPIIHRDIKSSNILLDRNWTARVSDFGLSLTGPESEGGHLSLKAAGTVGYMDPEYYGLHHLTAKSDVYGLGVVMLEVLTGKRAIFKQGGGDPTSVVEYAVPKISRWDLAKVLDTRVAPASAGEAEAVELLAYTAKHCVKMEGKDRPKITDVVVNLETALLMCEDEQDRIFASND